MSIETSRNGNSSTSGHAPVTAPAATNGRAAHMPTLARAVTALEEQSDLLLDAVIELDVARSALELELRRQARLKQARDARYRQRRREALAAG